MWNQNLSIAPMALKSMCRTGIIDNKFVMFADMIDQLASIVDRELSTIPELSDAHLSVLNDGYLSVVNDNVGGQEQFATPIFNDLYIDYEDIEDFLTNFDFKKKVPQRIDVNRVDSINHDCNNQPNTANTISPIGHTDKATNCININEIAEDQSVSEHLAQNVKYFRLTVNVDESYLCDMSKTTIHVCDSKSPMQFTSQQLQSLLKPVSITIDTESAAKLSLELAEASAKSKTSPSGSKTSENKTTITAADSLLQSGMRLRYLPSNEANYRTPTEMFLKPPMHLLIAYRERRAKFLKRGPSLVSKIRRFHAQSFYEDPNGTIANWSHCLSEEHMMWVTKDVRFSNSHPKENVTHTFDNFKRPNLPCPKRAAQDKPQHKYKMRRPMV